MEMPTKILACGVLIAGVVGVANAGFNGIDAAEHQHRLEIFRRRRNELQARCIVNGKSSEWGKYGAIVLTVPTRPQSPAVGAPPPQMATETARPKPRVPVDASASNPHTSWMDALPAVAPTAAMQMLVAERCDPAILATSNTDLVGVQKELANAEEKLDVEMRRRPREWPYIVATLTLGFSLIPWVWYFFLRRVRELSDAARGR